MLHRQLSSCILPRSNGISVAMRDPNLPLAPQVSNFGAKDTDLGLVSIVWYSPKPTSTFSHTRLTLFFYWYQGEHPFARWKQTWEDVEPHLVK